MPPACLPRPVGWSQPPHLGSRASAPPAAGIVKTGDEVEILGMQENVIKSTVTGESARDACKGAVVAAGAGAAAARLRRPKPLRTLLNPSGAEP